MKKLLEVKKKIGTLSKNAKNPFFKSQYLDLNELLNAVDPLLQSEGLILLQPINDNKVWTQIIDSEDGKIIADSYLDLPNISDPQKLGSAITYYRRYTLKSLLGIAEKDDDGNNAVKGVEETEKKTLTAESAKLNASKKVPLEKLREVFDLTPDQEDKYQKLLDSQNGTDNG